MFKWKNKKYQSKEVQIGTKTGEDVQKFMDIKEFRERGYLQEINRRFLHPLGLALVIAQDKKSGNETLMGIWDSRDDDEGIIFGFKESKTTRKSRFRKNKKFIDEEFEKRNKSRINKLGYTIEPID